METTLISGVPPMKNACSIDINAPIRTVFDIINDSEKHKLWLDGLLETIHEEGYDPTNPLGSRFKQKIREGRKVEVYDGEVTAYKRPKHLGVRVFNAAFSAQVDYRLTSLKKKTHVVFTSEVTFKSVAFRMLAGFSGPMVRGMLEKQLSKLKELAESEG
jgi:uncharacterized protein YndB with AHSA1/START domain